MEKNIWKVPLTKLPAKDGTTLVIEIAYHEYQDGRTHFEPMFNQFDHAGVQINCDSFYTKEMMRSVVKEDSSIKRIARTISTFIPSTSLDSIISANNFGDLLDMFYWPISDYASMIHHAWKNRDVDDEYESEIAMILATSFNLDRFYKKDSDKIFENPIVFPVIETQGSHPAFSVEWGKSRKRVGFIMGYQDEYYKCLKAVADLINHDGEKI